MKIGFDGKKKSKIDVGCPQEQRWIFPGAAQQMEGWRLDQNLRFGTMLRIEDDSMIVLRPK